MRDLEISGLSDRVDMLGWVADVYELMRSFDAFGYLLRPDTFATTENAVLEALACGVPVVMPRDPLGKYILGKEGGILVSSPDEYAAAMKLLAGSADTRQRIGQNGRAHVMKTSRGKYNAKNFYEFCRTIMNKEKTMHCFLEDGSEQCV